IIGGKRAAEREHRRQEGCDPNNAGCDRAQQLRLRSDAQRKKTHHDHEKEDRRQHVRAAAPRQHQIAPNDPAQHRKERRCVHVVSSSRLVWPVDNSNSWCVATIAMPPPVRWFSIKDLTRATAPLSNEVSTSSSSQSVVLQTSRRASPTLRRCPSDKKRAGSDSRPAKPISFKTARARSLLTSTPFN